MKIGFMGSQGTGKTSVANALEKDKDVKARDWRFVPSTARVALSAGHAVNKDAQPLDQILTTLSRIVAEYYKSSDAHSTFSDRTPLDSLAYTAYQMNNMWKNNEATKFYWDISCGIVLKHMKEYDKLFYFPVYWDPEDDGVRDPDVDYQKQIEYLLHSFIEAYDIPVVTMRNESVEARVQFIKESIFN